MFRQTKEVEAISQYKMLNKVLTVLVRSTSSLADDVKIQLACDTIREHPTWNCAHVAAYVGLFECFRDREVERLVTGQELNRPFNCVRVCD